LMTEGTSDIGAFLPFRQTSQDDIRCKRLRMARPA
jgi:hypothetical protein